jgi:hypothetical protein
VEALCVFLEVVAWGESPEECFAMGLVREVQLHGKVFEALHGFGPV